MTHNPRLKWAALVVCFFVGMAMSRLGSIASNTERPAIYISLLMIVATVIILIAALVWWRSLDELAREAHKSAWFWGGSFGVLIVLPVMFGAVEMVRRNALDLKDMPPEVGLLLGISIGVGTAVGGTLSGYLVAWVIFWLRKR
ncbi:MAG: hypothetical protein AAF830_04395 [Pseudomonadota bacterium]